ncbi:MAG: TonB-dependent receptor plug domain-containing protein, partial [Ginsengibacter sp.]
MSKTIKGIFILIIIGLQFPVFAQKKSISGRVVNDSNNEPLSGVSVVVQSSQAGVITNNDGIYKIDANTNDVLVISFVGFSNQLIPIKGRSEINISLKMEAGNLSDIVVLGSRGAGRAKLETTVPVDVIKMSDVGFSSAKMDVTSILNVAVPSLNYNKQSGSDGADHIDIATLRGLSPDQTLVLINGKRRHPASVILLFGTRGTGSSGTDLNGFPASAIDRVEVLRDGASAQYGSDAIAGVINLILKKDVGHFKMNVGYSGYNDPKFNSAYAKGLAANQYISGGKFDGQALNVSADGGLPIGKRGGFIHLSGDFTTQGKAFRQVLQSDNLSTTYWSLPINSVRRANGD